ncbi:MAG: ABC transporter permease [Tepidimonas sp.]|uniref:ABC transporter permease n=1 Tax=Tepidimonas sp. TaxID=2002775 RepID=UPI004055186B
MKAGHRHAWSLALLLAPVLIWLLGLLVLPHVELLLLSLQARIAPGLYAWSWQPYAVFFSEPLYWHTYVRTAWLSLLATGITLVLAMPVAWMIAKVARPSARGGWMLLVLIPFWVSELVRTLGWLILLRADGVIARLLSAIGVTSQPVELLYHDATILLGLVYGSLLFMVVPLVNSLETLSDDLLEAAYDLGGSHLDVWRHIVLPHAAPGIMAGCIVVFMLCVGNYLTPTLLGGKDSLWFTELVYTQFITRFNWNQGAAFGILLLVLSTALVWMGLRLSGQRLESVMRAS